MALKTNGQCHFLPRIVSLYDPNKGSITFTPPMPRLYFFISCVWVMLTLESLFILRFTVFTQKRRIVVSYFDNRIIVPFAKFWQIFRFFQSFRFFSSTKCSVFPDSTNYFYILISKIFQQCVTCKKVIKEEFMLLDLNVPSQHQPCFALLLYLVVQHFCHFYQCICLIDMDSRFLHRDIKSCIQNE